MSGRAHCLGDQLEIDLASPLQPCLRGTECGCGVGSHRPLPCLFTLGRHAIEKVVVISGLVYFMVICYFMIIYILVTNTWNIFNMMWLDLMKFKLMKQLL